MRASQSATSRPRWHSRPSAGLRLSAARVRPVVDRHVTARGHAPCTLSCRSPLFSLGRSGGGEAFDGDTVARGRAGGKTGSSQPAGFGPRESRRLTTLRKHRVERSDHEAVACLPRRRRRREGTASPRGQLWLSAPRKVTSITVCVPCGFNTPSWPGRVSKTSGVFVQELSFSRPRNASFGVARGLS